MRGSELFIAGVWVAGQGPSFAQVNPTTQTEAWSGAAASAAQVDAAISAARDAQPAWARTPMDERIARLQAFAKELEARKPALTRVISEETGKPLWEAATEVDAMIRKVPLSIDAYRERRRPTEAERAGEVAATRYKPHGVLAVFGPFNFPGHLPNGHIVPALLAGNTVVFKPSEQAPGVGQMTVHAWEAAGLPAGAINLVQGTRDVGALLAAHSGIDGLLFTGSFPTGQALSHAFANDPGKILALELGGNNPLVVWDAADLPAAAYLTILSAFITSGQRCSCARRLIVPENERGSALLDELVRQTKSLRVGRYDEEPEPFMGALISTAAADAVIAAETKLLDAGATAILPVARMTGYPAVLRPGIVDVTYATSRPDTEVFGPLLQVVRVPDFEAAIREANSTSYGLCAGLLSDDARRYEQFYHEARAGLINWNRPTTGANSALPFGGVGHSGNHRPSGSWAVDYCSYPVASLEAKALVMPGTKLPGT